MELRILGPVEVVDPDGTQVRLPGGKPRALLAVLALNANRAVPVERLVDDVWGEQVPETATKAIQIYVSQLRKTLPEGLIRTRPPGYLLELEPERIDLYRFQQLVAEGRAALAAGEAGRASRLLAEALALWRGPALAEFSEPFAAGESARLGEERLSALEERIDADLALARHPELVSELEALVARHPLRERLRGQQMLALYRNGRQADSLAAYHDLRRHLDEELGIEPSKRLRDLERRILQQDPDLAAPAAAPSRQPPGDDSELPAGEPGRTPATEPAGQPVEAVAGAREAERRQLTVLSCDLAEAAALSARLDPEEFREVAAQHVRVCSEQIEAFGGSVARLQGSRLVALFGYPRAHEDDPRRAVSAALEIVVASRSGPTGGPGAPAVRIGIETGLVVVDEEAAGRGSLQALGEAPSVASALEQRAAPDEVLVGPRTLRLTSDYFATEPAGGVDAPTPLAHRVLGPTEISSRLEAAARHGLTPFTGRAGELALLAAALDTAAAGEGQVVDVAGAPGAGKSRLLLEFAAGLDRDRIAVLEGRCRSFGAAGSDTSYQPFVELLAGLLGLPRDEGVDALVERAVARLEAIDPELLRYFPYYLQLLSVVSDRYPLPPRFMGEEKRRAFEEALAALLTVVSRSRPVVIVLEDWHWADEASDSALRYLVGAIPSFRILLVVAHRPEYRVGFAGLGHHSTIALRPLGRSETATLAAACLGVDGLPAGLTEAIHRHTDGNPLFVEELCNALVEEGTLELAEHEARLTRPLDDLVLPATVQAVIRSRLDHLDPEAQEILRLASVVGLEFERTVLERLVADPGRLDDVLAGLVAQDLVQQTAVLPEVAYAFKHVLTQIVVYETLLLERRRELHARAGEAVERLRPELLVQLSDSLAHHFDLGEAWDKAVAYHVQAGVKAFRHHVVGSALRHFERAAEILAVHGPAIEWRRHFELALHRGLALGEIGRWPAAYESISEADLLAAEHDPGTPRVQALFARTNAAFWAHRFDDSLRLAEELERLVGDDLHARLGVTAMQALTSFMNEHLSTALEKERELTSLLRQAPGSPYASRAAFVLGVFSRWRGDGLRAVEHLSLAVEHDREGAGAGVYLQSLLHYCLALGDLGRYREAIDLLLEGREYGERADSLYGVLKIDNTLGWLYQELCDYPEAMRYNELCLLSTNEARGTDTSTLSEIDAFARLNIGDLLLAAGEVERAREHFESAYSHIHDDQYVLARTRWKARCLLGLGDAAVAEGDVTGAERLLSELDVQGFTEGFPFKKLQARALRLRGRVLAARGEAPAAERSLADALGRARKVGNPGELWKTYLALGDLLVACGERDRGRASYRDAAELVQRIAGDLPGPLRESFERSAPVRDVLARARGD